MIELRTLGALELRGADGHEFRPILQQPKRLALLVYLAVATPRRFHRRDTLLGIFWPELDAEHARPALRRALYFLRRSLGDEVIVGRGDEEIGLAADALWCDTTAFETSLAAGDLAGALELYRGDLLGGFYIAGAPEFERWLERERGHLLQRASAAGWTLTEQLVARGDVEDAVRRARHVAALTPYDENAHRRLVALLAGLGDRATALRTYTDFAKRLSADYEVEPSAETQALVATIRARRDVPMPNVQRPAPNGGRVTDAAPGPAPAGIASGPSSVPNGAPAADTARRALLPTVIAVLPFTVRGSRDLAYLGEGMVDLLSTTLDGAGEYRTVDPRALLSFLARDEGTPLDPARGHAVARHFEAGLFLLGTIVEADGRLRISAALYRTDAGAGIAAEVQGAAEAGLFDMVDELARQLLVGESVGPGARLAKLAARTTQSLSALKAYLRGESEFRAGRYFQALEAFQNAAAEDACFALAYYRLAAAAAATANLELAREAAEQAFANRERLGEHDRLLVDAQRAWLVGAADEAERLYTATLATYVDDMEAWFLLGDVLFHHNPLRGRSFVEAREAFERALRYEPEHLSSLVHLARIAAFEGDIAALDSLVDRVLRLSPAGDRALSMRALRAFTLGNQIEKARTVTALGRARALAVGIAFTDIVLYARDLGGSHRLARIFTKLTRAPEGKALCHIVLAYLNMAKGRGAKALTELDAAAALDAAWALELRALFAMLPFRPVSPAELTSVRVALAAWNADEVPPNRNQVLAVHNGLHAPARLYLIGSTSVRLGDTDEAARSAVALERLGGPDATRHFARHLAGSVRAQIAWAEGDAAGALRLLDAARFEVWYQLTIMSPFYSAAYERYMRAEILRTLGRDEEALGWYDALGESAPYELIYRAPASLRQAEIHQRLGHREQAAGYVARALELWDGCDPELHGR